MWAHQPARPSQSPHMTSCLQHGLLRRSALLLHRARPSSLRRVAPGQRHTVSMAAKPPNEMKNKWVAVVGASRGIGLEVGCASPAMPQHAELIPLHAKTTIASFYSTEIPELCL